jgi:hypothetical protein
MGIHQNTKIVILPKPKLELDRRRKLEILSVLRKHDPEITGLSFEYGDKGELREIQVRYFQYSGIYNKK